MTGPEIVARGQALLGKGIRYEMGADDLTEPGLALDCSAFACRCRWRWCRRQGRRCARS